MMFKSKLATFVGALVLAGSSFAIQDKPESCPSITAVQAEGMTSSAEIIEGLYLTYNLSHFDTSSNWVFVMGPVAAETDEMAIEESNQLLTTISGTPTPTQDEEDTWICEYNTGSQELAAFAILTDDAISPFKMGRYIRRHH